MLHCIGGQRDDVGAAFPAYPNAGLSGFTLSKHIDVDPSRTLSHRARAGGQYERTPAGGGADRGADKCAGDRRTDRGGAAKPETLPAVTSSLTMPEATYRLVAGFQLGPDLLPLLPTPIRNSIDPTVDRSRPAARNVGFLLR